MFGRGEPVKVGRFVLIRRLGSGAHGNVFLAEDPELSRKVALKLLRAANPTARARLRREAQTLARLNHPNVLTVYEVGVQDDRVWLATELVDGGTLAQWCGDNPAGSRRLSAVLGFAIALGEGLAAAHAEGIVHRDIKPANVLLGADGRPRLADFGLAALHDRRPDPNEPQHNAVARPLGVALHRSTADDATALTSTGDMVGTPAYMAPEQRIGRGDARSDQWGLCSTLWEATFGERFDPDVPPPRRRGVPGWWRQVLRRGLHEDPARRWPSMNAWVEAVRLGRGGTRRKQVLAGLAVLATAMGGFAWGTTRVPTCDRFDDALNDVWNDAQVDALVERSQQRERMDDFVSRFRVDARQACQAGDEVTIACLRGAARGFEAIVDVMRTPEPIRVGTLESLTVAIPDLGRCADPKRRGEVPDGDEEIEVAGEMSRAHALVIQLRLTEAQQVLDALEPRIERLGKPDLHARFLTFGALAKQRAGDQQASERMLERALDYAQAGGDERFVLDLRLRIATIAASEGRIEQAEFLLRRVEASLAGLTGDDAKNWRASLLQTQAGVDVALKDYDAAVHRLEQAVQLEMEVGGAHAHNTAVAWQMLARGLTQAKRTAEAVAACREAAVAFEAALGPTSGETVKSWFALAVELEVWGRMDEAVATIRLARERLANAGAELQAGDQVLFHSRAASLFAKTGHRDEAVAALARASEIIDTLPPEHPMRAVALNSRGAVLLDIDEPEAAIEAFEALEQHEQFSDDPYGDSQRVARCVNLAAAYARAARLDDATRRAQACEPLLAGAPNDVQGAAARSYIAEAWEAAGEYARAAVMFREAKAILDAAPGTELTEASAIEEGVRRAEARGL